MVGIRSRSIGRRRWPARIAVMSFCVAVVGVFGPATAQARKPPQSYVALGDSYTAGPVIPVQQPDPYGCLRSDHNYPHLVAAALGVGDFKDPSCSGADTGDMTAPHRSVSACFDSFRCSARAIDSSCSIRDDFRSARRFRAGR